METPTDSQASAESADRVIPAGTQTLVRGLAMLAEDSGTTKSQQLSDWYVAQLAANGMQVQPAGDGLRGDLESIGATMTDEWMKLAGDEGKAIVDGFNAAK